VHDRIRVFSTRVSCPAVRMGFLEAWRAGGRRASGIEAGFLRIATPCVGILQNASAIAPTSLELA